MKKYYAERHGLLTKQLQIDFDELLQYFGQVYKYFCDKEYFEVATRGVWRQIPYTQDSEQILPPSLLPSPEVYFATCLQDKEVVDYTSAKSSVSAQRLKELNPSRSL